MEDGFAEEEKRLVNQEPQCLDKISNRTPSRAKQIACINDKNNLHLKPPLPFNALRTTRSVFTSSFPFLLDLPKSGAFALSNGRFSRNSRTLQLLKTSSAMAIQALLSFKTKESKSEIAYLISSLPSVHQGLNTIFNQVYNYNNHLMPQSVSRIRITLAIISVVFWMSFRLTRGPKIRNRKIFFLGLMGMARDKSETAKRASGM
ncbi:hypothetical protein F2Q70_00022293 [Brassica cretica]|uniref:Uncharacterized protein n=1 Tax=Brassica cretica TaxID=69181 RepID=A0A8S9HK92_BRACR|nr:hypothetical protein F2Q70_00022293 [Brassica cretica]KAF2557754.1 hypothetical protein F2Q68_00016316 [Brassica cretica]